ncbi:TPX2-like protein [Drosera capensis]
MEMDEEIVECEVVPVFEAVEIDFEYEFEAVRFFDFCRRETEDEVREAEAWFESAPSYPPSPFVAKMFLREDVMSTNVNTSPKSRVLEKEMIEVENNAVQNAGEEIEGAHEGCSGMIHTILKGVRDSDVPNTRSLRQALIKASSKGLSLCSQSAVGMGSTRSRSNAKSPFQRKSTLMKPTVSQLAKKSLGSQQINTRLMMLPDEENGSSSTHCGVEIQASKRQKLDGGFFQKVGEIKQPSNLVHKLPRKDLTVSGMGAQSKLKPTVPREPELETALRAHRVRSKAAKETENAATVAVRFKARPLNRKILEGPLLPIPKRSTPTLPEFHVFHLKTAERAMQHAATTMSSLHFQNDKGLGRTTAVPNSKNGRKDGQRSESAEATNKGDHGEANSFNAKPLDKNVFPTEGDLGAFKNMKRDITEPKGLQFQSEKRNKQNPPVELFSKLSLASDALPNSTTTKLSPARLQSKDIFN